MIHTRWFAILGLALFAWIVWSAGPDKLLASLLSVNPILLAIAAALIPVSILLKSLKWKIVLSRLGQKVCLRDACNVWMIGLFAATLTPGRLGDFVKSLYAHRAGLSAGSATAAVFIERLSDLIALFSLAAIGVMITVLKFGSGLAVTFSLVFFIIGGFAILWMLTQKRLVAMVAKPLYKYVVPEKYKGGLRVGFDDMYASIKGFLNIKLIPVLALTYCCWLVSFASGWFVARSLGLDISFLFIAAFTPIVVIIELIPITVAGFGTREAALIFLFGLLGVAANSVVAYSLLGVTLNFATAAVGGIFWMHKPIPLSFGKGGISDSQKK